MKKNTKTSLSEITALADKREEFGYTKPLTHEELVELKDELSQKVIEVRELKNTLKVYSTQIKGQMKPLLEEKEHLAETIKGKAKFVNEMCSVCFEQEKGIAEYYSETTGDLVHTRPLTADEKQTNIKFLKQIGE